MDWGWDWDWATFAWRNAVCGGRVPCDCRMGIGFFLALPHWGFGFLSCLVVER